MSALCGSGVEIVRWRRQAPERQFRTWPLVVGIRDGGAEGEEGRPGASDHASLLFARGVTARRPTAALCCLAPGTKLTGDDERGCSSARRLRPSSRDCPQLPGRGQL